MRENDKLLTEKDIPMILDALDRHAQTKESALKEITEIIAIAFAAGEKAQALQDTFLVCELRKALSEARKQGARELADKIRKSNKADDFYISFTDKDLDDLLKELEG